MINKVKWISVDESLPKDNKLVTAVIVGNLTDAWYVSDKATWHSKTCQYHESAISHWAEISKPKLP
jgi:hypothetical protein